MTFRTPASVKRIISHIPYGDVEKNNEASGVQLFRIGVPKNPHGLSRFSSASLYLKTQSSTPCAILANSLDSTFFCRYSSISGGRVTVNDIFFLGIQDLFLHIPLNIILANSFLARIILAGTPKHDTKNSYSDAKPGDHGQGHHHGMSGEQRGTRPRLRLGPPSVHGEEGGAGGHAGGLRPPALDGPLGSGLRLSGVRA